MEAPGKGLLKVVSILFIIGGALVTIISILALAGSAILSNVVDQTQSVMAAGLGGILLFGSILLLITGVLELIMGIIGYRRSDNPTSANFFITTGIILGLIALVSMILSFSIWSLIGFILPVLYIIGGAMNKKAIT